MAFGCSCIFIFFGWLLQLSGVLMLNCMICVSCILVFRYSFHLTFYQISYSRGLRTMDFSCNLPCKKLLIYSFILYISMLSLLVSSYATSEELSARARQLLPFEKKTVMIINLVRNAEILNVHCSSSEDD